MMGSLVICSAAAFETEPLIGNLALDHISFTRVICGVGAIDATAVAARMRDLVMGRFVVFIGTGGIIGAQAAGRIKMVSEVSLAPYDVRSGTTELVAGFDPPVSLHTPAWGLETCRAAGSLGVSVAADPSPRYEGFLETMELYAVARQWVPVASRFVGILCETNSTGPDARAEWRREFQSAAHNTGTALTPVIKQFFRE